MSYPEVGEKAVIFANAVVFGDIRVGAGSVVGAGSIVNRSVPDGAVVAGNPARPIYAANNMNLGVASN